MIEQVLFNILDNALKYSPPDSPIDIAAKVDDGDMVVEVSDRGPGIDETELDRVFDKLYRGTVGKNAGRGAGLGLAIARAVVEAHGGRIWARPRPGGGSVFAFSLPLDSELPEPDYGGELENQPEEL
jgi:two-component system sensor histidine kinase KdpD